MLRSTTSSNRKKRKTKQPREKKKTKTTTLQSKKKRGQSTPQTTHYKIQIKSKLCNVFFFSKMYVMYFLFITNKSHYVHFLLCLYQMLSDYMLFFLHQNVPFSFRIKGHQNELLFLFFHQTHLYSFFLDNFRTKLCTFYVFSRSYCHLSTPNLPMLPSRRPHTNMASFSNKGQIPSLPIPCGTSPLITTYNPSQPNFNDYRTAHNQSQPQLKIKHQQPQHTTPALIAFYPVYTNSWMTSFNTLNINRNPSSNNEHNATHGAVSFTPSEWHHIPIWRNSTTTLTTSSPTTTN